MTEEVFFTREGQLGLITLNRPNALNALNLPMIKEMQRQLIIWKADDSVKAVVLQAAPGNAFCAPIKVQAQPHHLPNPSSTQFQH